MVKATSSKIIAITVSLVLLSVMILARPASAIVSQQSLSWYWSGDTTSVSLATGDVNGDGKTEVVTGGYFNDLTRWNAFVAVLNGSTLAPLSVLTWYWVNDTQVSSVAVGDINADNKSEVVIGGSFFDNTRWNAFCAVLNGSTLAPLSVLTWYWVNDTQVSSVAAGDINADNKAEVVLGGSFFDNTRRNAFAAVLNGSTLAPLNVLTWYWTNNTYVSTVDIGDVNADTNTEVVIGGSFSDNTRDNAFLAVLNGATLAPLNVLTWYWTNNTYVNSVTVGDINPASGAEIVMGGSYLDNTRNNAFVAVLNGVTLQTLNLQSWYWTSNTQINSVAVGNFSGGNALDVITSGYYNDGVKDIGYLVDWNATGLSPLSSATWFLTSDTAGNSVAVDNFGSGNRIAVSGSYWDLTRSNAHVAVWG